MYLGMPCVENLKAWVLKKTGFEKLANLLSRVANGGGISASSK